MKWLAKLKAFATQWKLPLVLLAIALTLAGLWQFSPLAEYANPSFISQSLKSLRGNWWIALAVPPVYILASSLMFPNMVMDIATILSFGGLQGWSFAILGSLSSTSFYFMVGRRFGSKKLENIENRRFKQLRELLRRGGLGTVITVRILPLAPFTVVNITAGAMGIRFWYFLFGTFIALLPGTLTLTFFHQHLKTFLQEPNFKNIAIGVLILLVGALALWLSRRYAKGQIDKDKKPN